MKHTTFKRFLSNYAKDMNRENSLSLFKNEKYSQDNVRLLTVFSFYVFFNNEVTQTLLRNKEKLPTLYNMYTKFYDKYRNLTYDNVDKVVNNFDEFDELKKLYKSYTNLYVNKYDMVKKAYHQKIRQIQKEKQISNYRIYTDLKINHGNTNDFLKNANYDKLSQKNIKSIYHYVTSF